MKLLWKMFPHAAFFEVYVPVREKGESPQLPLVLESTDARLVEPYSKMFYRLFTAREIPLFRMLFMNANCDPVIAHRIAANLAITLASEDIVTYLVDLDLRKPTLHDVFHAERSPGMVEFLLKGAEPEGVIRETGVPELRFVPSGSPIEDPDKIVSALGWRNTLEKLIPPGVVSLIYMGRGDGFDMSELMKEVDGTILLISSGEKIDRWVRKELKLIKKKSDVVGVIWTNPMEYPFRRYEESTFEDDIRDGAGLEKEDGVEVEAEAEADYPLIDEEKLGIEVEGESDEAVSAGEEAEDGEEDVRLASRDLLATFASRLNEINSMESEKTGEDREEAGKGAVYDREKVEPVRDVNEVPDTKTEEEGMKKVREESWKTDEVVEEQELEMSDPGLDEGELELYDDYHGGSSGNRMWIAIFGVVFLFLLGWLLYESGLFTQDEQLQEILTEGGMTEEVTPGIETEGIPVEEPAVTEEAPAGAAGEEMAAASAVIPPTAVDLPYSLVLGSFQQAESAGKGKDQFVQAGFDVYLVPVEIPGLGRWFRIMLGQYADREAAAAALEGIKKGTRFEDGRIVQSSLAFLMGSFNSMDMAVQAMERIESKGLDPYILESEGEEAVYSLYLGAFENEDQSRYLGEMIEENGLSGSLVSRKGYHR